MSQAAKPEGVHRRTGQRTPGENQRRIYVTERGCLITPRSAAEHHPRMRGKPGRCATRDLRSVLAHRVLFAWNRAGISACHQAFFSATAARVVFHHTLGIEDAPTSLQVRSPAATLEHR